MTNNIDLIIKQTVAYDANGYPYLLQNNMGTPYLMFDAFNNRVVITDSNHTPLVVADMHGNLLTLFDIQTTPGQTYEEFQQQTSCGSRLVGGASAESVGNSKNVQKSIPVVKRDEIYKTVKKLDVDTVKQFLLYESIIDGSSRFFINFDESDAYNYLTNKLIRLDKPYDKLDYLALLKSEISIPNSFLDWFSDDLRAGLNLASRISLSTFGNCYYGELEFLYWIKSVIKVSILTMSGDEKITIKIDIVENSIEKSIDNLMFMKMHYLKNRTKTDWLNEKDTEQVKCAYNYLSERKIILFDGVFFPKTISDEYNLVLASIDVLPNTIKEHTVPNGANKLNFTRRELLVYKMCRAWDSILGTRKRAEQKSKRVISVNQSNFESLLKLSTHYKLTPTKMLNKLIEDQYSLLDDNS